MAHKKSIFETVKHKKSLEEIFSSIEGHTDVVAAFAIIYMSVINICESYIFLLEKEAVVKLSACIKHDTYFWLDEQEITFTINSIERIKDNKLAEMLKLLLLFNDQVMGRNLNEMATGIIEAVNSHAISICVDEAEYQKHILPQIKIELAYNPLTNGNHA